MKGQSEIMGLAVVMVLLSVGFLLYVSFNLKTDHVSSTVKYNYQQLPVLLNNAILDTHTKESDCYGEKIQKLLIKAGEGNSLICNDGTLAKEFSKDFISKILNETLAKWQMEYIYSVYTGEDFSVCNSLNPNYDTNCVFVLTNSKNSCYKKDINTENFFFRMNNGRFINIKLDICS